MATRTLLNLTPCRDRGSKGSDWINPPFNSDFKIANYLGTHVHAHTRTHIHTNTHTHTHISTQMHSHKHTHTNTYPHKHFNNENTIQTM